MRKLLLNYKKLKNGITSIIYQTQIIKYNSSRNQNKNILKPKKRRKNKLKS